MTSHSNMRETHDQLLVYVPKKDMNEFRKWCLKNDIKMSQVIRKFIKDTVNGI